MRRRQPKRQDRAAKEAAENIAKLRAVAENPLVRPSLRMEARRALKALVPARKPVVVPSNAARLWPGDPVDE